MKAYVKPELFYEHFELSQHVASCTLVLNQGVGSCESFSVPGMGEGYSIFQEQGKCTDIITNPDIYCYMANGVDSSAGVLFIS